MDEPVRLALAGAGWVAAVHGLAAQALPATSVVAVASRTRARARDRATELGAVIVEYAELPAVADVVVVGTNPATHAALALACLDAGVAVVIEKPLCVTLDEADRLVAAAEAGGRVCYAENLLFAPAVSAALSEIASIGEVTHLSARALQSRPTWGDFLHRHWGGGVLFDLGVHPLAVVLRAARESVVAVSAELDGADDIEVDEWASVRLRFASGRTATVEASWRATTPVWDLQAASDTGVVRLELLPDLALERDGEPVPLPPPPTGDHPPQLEQFGYVDQLREALAAFAADTSCAISDATFGRDVLEIVHAAYESAGTGGTEVALPFTGPRHLAPIDRWLRTQVSKER